MSEPKSGARSRTSAGVPDVAADSRLAELEERLAHLEGETSLQDRGRHLLDRIMPPEASRHFFNGGREHLLGIRSIVDFWLHRLDDMEVLATGKDDAKRHSIEID